MKLPIGISNFAEIRKNHRFYYVDKTRYIKDLVNAGKYYFLSRPRRFGKSLLIDTFKEAFSAARDLFTGLYLENHWDWDTAYPVISINFGGGVISDRTDLDRKISFLLESNARRLDIDFHYETVRERFHELILRVCERYDRRVVILVDEYDKPLLYNITDESRAAEIRDGLKNFYSVIKDCDAQIEFCFLTGVSKFSKVSLFSGLNNLEDISLAPEAGAICGYSQNDLETVFQDRLDGVDLDAVRKWYNGYSFLGEKVYNPFDVLLYLKHRVFQNYWFETAIPGFLIKLLKRRRYFLPALEKLKIGQELVGSFDVDDLVAEALLFQTGYLTIQSVEEPLPGSRYFILGYPNFEVKTSLNTYLINDLSGDRAAISSIRLELVYDFRDARLTELRNHLQALFAAIPHHWYRKNDLDNYEGYYASVVYACFASLGFDVIAEDVSSHGQADLALLTETAVFLFEFKVTELTESAGAALNQIKSRGYHQKYLSRGKPVYLIGIDFSRAERNITGFEWERVENEVGP